MTFVLCTDLNQQELPREVNHVQWKIRECEQKRKNKLTLAPNSTKLAKFCKAFATSFKDLIAISEGVSERKL